MRHNLKKFTKDYNAVLAFCMRTEDTLEDCRLNSKHQKCIGWNCDSRCIEKVMSFSLQTFSRQFLSEESYNMEEKEVPVTGLVYLNMLSFVKSARPRNIWITVTGIPAVLSFSSILLMQRCSYRGFTLKWSYLGRRGRLLARCGQRTVFPGLVLLMQMLFLFKTSGLWSGCKTLYP